MVVKIIILVVLKPHQCVSALWVERGWHERWQYCRPTHRGWSGWSTRVRCWSGWSTRVRWLSWKIILPEKPQPHHRQRLVLWYPVWWSYLFANKNNICLQQKKCLQKIVLKENFATKIVCKKNAICFSFFWFNSHLSTSAVNITMESGLKKILFLSNNESSDNVTNLKCQSVTNNETPENWKWDTWELEGGWRGKTGKPWQLFLTWNQFCIFFAIFVWLFSCTYLCMEYGETWENWSAFTICTGIDTLIWRKFTQIQKDQFATMFSMFAASLVVSVLSRATTRNFLLCMIPPGISKKWLPQVCQKIDVYSRNCGNCWCEDWEVFPQHSGNICFLWMEPFPSPMCLF